MSEETTVMPVDEQVDITEQTTEVGDLQDMVDDLIVFLHEAKSVPLSGNAIIDRDQFLGILERITAALPDELRAARWMVREREAFIARTNEKAREIVDKARKEADDLIADSNIVAEAVEEANILVRRAEGEARRLRLETEDEVEKQLQRVESLLAETVAQVQAARSEFHRARPKAPDVPV
jgi:cell division septum initiation protein DivIVA